MRGREEGREKIKKNLIKIRCIGAFEMCTSAGAAKYTSPSPGRERESQVKSLPAVPAVNMRGMRAESSQVPSNEETSCSTFLFIILWTRAPSIARVEARRREWRGGRIELDTSFPQ